MKTKIWISALIPVDGGFIYRGIRLRASLTEEDCYRDLADWLDIEYKSKKQVRAALEAEAESAAPHNGFGIRMWKVERQEVTT